MVKSDIHKALDLIKKSNNILLTSHIRPDGDSCGSIAAMREALAALGKNVRLLFLSEVPQWYGFLFPQPPPVIKRDITIEQLGKENIDLIIVIDTDSFIQLFPIEEYLKRRPRPPVLVIDHHTTSDNIGDVKLLDASASAAGLIVLDLLDSADLPLTPAVAQALFVAVSTDTGWFQFGNTDSRTLMACARLIDAGVQPALLYQRLYQNLTFPRFKLLMAMLNSLQLYLDGRLAVVRLLQSDFRQTGAAYSDTENLIDYCRYLASPQVIALVAELADGRIKCSLRSRGPVDVRKIAEKFGGGGHPAASGTYLSAPMENAVRLIEAEVRAVLSI